MINRSGHNVEDRYSLEELRIIARSIAEENVQRKRIPGAYRTFNCELIHTDDTMVGDSYNAESIFAIPTKEMLHIIKCID